MLASFGTYVILNFRADKKKINVTAIHVVGVVGVGCYCVLFRLHSVQAWTLITVNSFYILTHTAIFKVNIYSSHTDLA